MKLKKLITTMLIGAMCIQGTTLAFANDKKIELAVGCPKALINGQSTDIMQGANVTPYLSKEGRTLVPIRFVSEAFGAEVQWIASERKVNINLGETKLSLTIDKSDYTLNGKNEKSDTPPIIVDSITRVPLRLVAEGLGLNVYWNDGLITISDSEQNIDGNTAKTQLEKIKNMCQEVPPQETAPAHNHTWVEQTAASVVHHEGSGHYEDVIVGVETHYTQVVTCRCGAQFSTQSEYVAHKESYPVPYVGHGGFETTVTPSGSTPIYEKQWVEDSAAWDETITEVVGYKCSTCGATK